MLQGKSAKSQVLALKSEPPATYLAVATCLLSADYIHTTERNGSKPTKSLRLRLLAKRMTTATQFLSEAKSLLLSTLAYLHRNAWTIIFILGGAYVFYDNCK